MVISFFDLENMKKYRINHYKHIWLDDNHIFVNSLHGGWVVLSKKEFDLLRFEKVEKDPNLFKQLENQGIVITKNNENWIIDTFRQRKSYLLNSVSLHIISVTLRCNHRCVYCHALSKPMNAKGYDMDEETAKKTVDFIFQSPSKGISIEFQGGEPLVNFPIIEYIIEYAREVNKTKKKRLSFNLVTNLTLMDRDILRFLIKNKVSLCTSLDGPKEIHDKNRKYLNGGSSYDKVVHWIKIIKNEYKHPLGALQTPTKFCLPFHKEIIDEYRRLRFNAIRMRQLNNAGMAHKIWKKIGYTPEEYVNFWKKALDYILDLNKKGIRIRENMSTLVARKLLFRAYPNYTCWGAPCGAALSQCGYDQNGDIFACDEARSFEEFKIGNVNQSYKDVFSSPAVANIVSISSGLLTKCEGCVWHPYCGSCVVCTYGQQNNPVGKMSIDNECMIRKGVLEHILRKLIFSEKDRNIIIDWSLSRGGV